MGWVRYFSLLLVFVLPASFAAIIESGDNGADFVNRTAMEKCSEQNVQAVYKCLANTVRVVSSVSGEGSTFYKPEGKVVSCPIVAPSAMGAECLQMMTPNFCPVQAECGFSIAPEIFPGANDTPEQTGDADAYIVSGESASDNAAEPAELQEPEPEPAVGVVQKTTAIENHEFDAPTTTKNNVDSPLGYLVYVVLLLGLGSVGVLFMLFRNSLADEDA